MKIGSWCHQRSIAQYTGSVLSQNGVISQPQYTAAISFTESLFYPTCCFSVIGHSDNRHTALRRCWSCANLKLLSSEGVLSGAKYRRFWLRYDRGAFSLGKHRQAAYFEWTDPSPPETPVRYLGFGSWGNPIDWVVFQNCP